MMNAYSMSHSGARGSGAPVRFWLHIAAQRLLRRLHRHHGHQQHQRRGPRNPGGKPGDLRKARTRQALWSADQVQPVYQHLGNRTRFVRRDGRGNCRTVLRWRISGVQLQLPRVLRRQWRPFAILDHKHRESATAGVATSDASEVSVAGWPR